MTTKLNEIIATLAVAFEDEGVSTSPDGWARVREEFRRQHAGETLYVERLPKLRNQVLAKQICGLTQGEQAASIGISTRQLRRITRGK